MSENYEVGENREYQELLEKYDSMKEQAATVFMQRDMQIRKDEAYLRAQYMKLIGCYEYEQYSLFVTNQRLKRQIELVQACINRDEPIDAEAIDRQLEKEYASYMEKLQDMKADLDYANEYLKSPTMTEKQETALRKVYRTLAKRLHPDMHPVQTEHEKALWHETVAAFRSGDLELLKTLEKMTAHIGADPMLPTEEMNAIDYLKEKIDGLEKIISRLIDEMEERRKKFPFSEEATLKDKEKVKERQAELREAIDNYKKSNMALTVKLAVMVAPKEK